MKKLIALALALPLGACAPQPGPRVPGVPAGHCSAEALGDLVGTTATPALVDRARKRSGASLARVLRAGQIVTMEYRDARLNVHVDARGVVTSLSCG